jgi:hypothetical protein
VIILLFSASGSNLIIEYCILSVCHISDFRPRDFALLGDIVQNIEKICAHLGWTEDLLEIQIENELNLIKDQ